MVKKNIRVPYGMSVHGKEEIEAVNKVLKTSTQMGKNVLLFEKKVSKLYKKKYALMVNSGSSALLLAFESLGLPPGSEIITPVLTFSTTISYLVKNNLVPVFIDVEEGSYCMNPYNLEKNINKKTKAILVPHLLGNIFDWSLVWKLAKKYNLLLIEDSADTIGAKIHNQYIGTLTDITITSFYGSHIINCAGNGGMICFNDKKLYLKSKLLRSWGRNSSLFKDSEKIERRFNINLDGIEYDSKFVFSELGHNLEPSELGAAFGLVQLKKLKKNVTKREKIFNSHLKFFNQYKKFFILPQQTPNTKTGWLAFPITIKDKAPFTRRELQIFLEKKNIQTRVIFTGNITRQPGFNKIKMIKGNKNFKEADKVMEGGILIACHHGLSDLMIKHIYNSLKSFLTKF